MKLPNGGDTVAAADQPQPSTVNNGIDSPTTETNRTSALDSQISRNSPDSFLIVNDDDLSDDSMTLRLSEDDDEEEEEETGAGNSRINLNRASSHFENKKHSLTETKTKNSKISKSSDFQHNVKKKRKSKYPNCRKTKNPPSAKSEPISFDTNCSPNTDQDKVPVTKHNVNKTEPEKLQEPEEKDVTNSVNKKGVEDADNDNIKQNDCNLEKEMQVKSEKRLSNITHVKRNLNVADRGIKKIKVNGVDDPSKEDTMNRELFIPLDSFKSFMEKKLISKLTRAELEEFTLQKICETIDYRCDLGETKRKLKIMEQLSDTWRSKVISLGKQVKDLEVVTSKLMMDLKNKKNNGSSIDATPIKITRSVGLQVCVPTIVTRTRPIAFGEPQTTTVGIKRKRSSLPNKIPSLTLINNNSDSPSSTATSISSSTIKTNSSPKPLKTILPNLTPKVLDIKENSSKPNTRTAVNVQTTVINQAVQKSKGVIDLTDEDDLRNTSTNSVSSQNKTPVRIVTTVANVTNMTTTANPQRLTYVVQTPTQQSSQFLFASAAPNRTNIRPTLMLRPIAPANAVPINRGSVRMNTALHQNKVLGTVGMAPQQINGGAAQSGYQSRYQSPNNRAAAQPHIISPRIHPAPLPGPPPLQANQSTWKTIPPKPTLKISKVGDGIVLSWRIMTKDLSVFEEIASYQLYAYQETNAPPSSDMWRKVGDVKALALPMACTLTQFTDGHKYHFAVRAVDVKSRVGPFSQPEQIMLS